MSHERLEQERKRFLKAIILRRIVIGDARPSEWVVYAVDYPEQVSWSEQISIEDCKIILGHYY